MIVVQGNEAAAWVARRPDGGCRHPPHQTNAHTALTQATLAHISVPYVFLGLSAAEAPWHAGLAACNISVDAGAHWQLRDASDDTACLLPN
ncbi:hypothetical protein E2C01_025971 [Portunus trituberculatus]|uniref:Uncharacterized protein n=1 Tax=Portunus trituberculatus TaxID=210409 RepID=A0A5B7EHF1_PORTR|nr:hypothetical protein [Portunus trituberculatus]